MERQASEDGYLSASGRVAPSMDRSVRHRELVTVYALECIALHNGLPYLGPKCEGVTPWPAGLPERSAIRLV